MKTVSTSKLLLPVVGAMLFVFATAQTTARHADEPPATTITSSGCVSAGVEAGCLLVTDSRTGTVYNVYFRNQKKPEVGSAIRFTGTPHNGPTTCMQGRAVNVQRWFPLKMKCRAKSEGDGC